MSRGGLSPTILVWGVSALVLGQAAAIIGYVAYQNERWYRKRTIAVDAEIVRSRKSPTGQSFLTYRFTTRRGGGIGRIVADRPTRVATVVLVSLGWIVVIVDRVLSKTSRRRKSTRVVAKNG